jgi:hypothetical protein
MTPAQKIPVGPSYQVPLARAVKAVKASRASARAQKGMRVPAGDMEGLVLDRRRAFFSSRIDVNDAIAPLDLDPQRLMWPCAMHSRFQSDGSPRRPSR